MASSKRRKKKSSQSKSAGKRKPTSSKTLEKRLRPHLPDVLPENLPRHVAIIMDGNGRWAQERGLPRYEGHKRGADSVAEVVAISREIGIKYLTLYAFSSENWRRPRFEVQALMHLLDEYLDAELDEMLEYGIRLHTIGNIDRLPKKIRAHLEDVIEKTKKGRRMTLTLALSYGGRQEIVRMARNVAAEARAGKITPRQVTEKYISQHLYTAGMPDPDLLIRTAGEYRLSNFLLWQGAYTELYVTKTTWPAFRRPQYSRALLEFTKRERRYGMTTEQLL